MINNTTDVFQISGTQAAHYNNPSDPFNRFKGNLFYLLNVQSNDQAQFDKDINRCTLISIDKNRVYDASKKASESEKNMVIENYKKTNNNNNSTNRIYTLHQGNYAASLEVVLNNYTLNNSKPIQIRYENTPKIEYGKLGLKFYGKCSQSAYVISEGSEDPTNDKDWAMNQKGQLVDISQNLMTIDELVIQKYKPIFTITSVAELDLTNVNSPIATFKTEVKSHHKSFQYIGPSPDQEPVVKELANIPLDQKFKQAFNKFSLKKKSKDDDGSSSPEKNTLSANTSPVSPRSETNNNNATATSSPTSSSPVILSSRSSSPSPSESPEKNNSDDDNDFPSSPIVISRSPSPKKEDNDSERDDDFTFLGNESDESSPKSDKKGKGKKK
jgi:hypothetical protein